MEWVIAIALWVLAANAAVHMARRKRRKAQAWGVLAFLFPPALLILFLARKREPVSGNAIYVRSCSACGGTVSLETDRCPHCGHPQRPARTWYDGLLEFAGTVAVIGWIVLAILFISQTAEALPTCDGSLAQIEVDRVFANWSIGKIREIWVVSLDAIRTDSADSNFVSCSTDALLSDDSKHKIIYKFTKRSFGKYLVEVRIAD
jgi:hypothetical protein